jgi:hypothetical protein
MHLPSPNLELFEIQKTFSAALCSISSHDKWFALPATAGKWFHPVLDSQFGRIAFKVSLLL